MILVLTYDEICTCMDYLKEHHRGPFDSTVYVLIFRQSNCQEKTLFRMELQGFLKGGEYLESTTAN